MTAVTSGGGGGSSSYAGGRMESTSLNTIEVRDTQLQVMWVTGHNLHLQFLRRRTMEEDKLINGRKSCSSQVFGEHTLPHNYTYVYEATGAERHGD